MSFLFRSTTTLRAATASSSRLTLPALYQLRYNSTLPTPSSSTPSEPAAPPPPKSGELFTPPRKDPSTLNGFSKLRFDPLTTPSGKGTDGDGEAWWRQLSKSALEGYPAHASTGRSIVLPRGGEFATSYRRLQGLLRQGNMKKEARLQEYYEKPSVRRRRLISERHRRRFKEMVSLFILVGAVR
uniref:Ribosomal protein S21 n=1 Tax=Kwoniella bestiolae CBS 10118 TaxID=1296100 RepID=A0A1B9FYP2_9TREE|nr:ribosomal protein S21 [Kwoniella bestiolae CBS 10118]OCF23889.1 ribosomal protein S21 [Kwoniella bestiolae CBS 10118]